MATVFTPEDVHRYYELIQLPTQFHSYPPNLKLLQTIHVYQISTMPYENLSIHYSPSHQTVINPREAFNKFLSGRGRGGYCMEIGIFYLHMLRAIGFIAYHTAVRTRLRVDGVPHGEYPGFAHIVSIVTLDEGKYVSDVAFGGDGPTAPMKLVENDIVTNLGSQEVRYALETIPQFESEQKYWIYQYRNRKDRAWNSYYSFQEIPFHYNDFEVFNYFTSTNSHQVHTVLIVRFLREGSEIVGKVMLVNGTVKKNLGGKTEVVFKAKTEEERVEALRIYFGITLTDLERSAIHGRSTELVNIDK